MTKLLWDDGVPIARFREQVSDLCFIKAHVGEYVYSIDLLNGAKHHVKIDQGVYWRA